MIENYERIEIFIPKTFKKLNDDTRINELQKFADYVSEQFELLNSYKVILSSDLDNDILITKNKKRIFKKKQTFDVRFFNVS